jgi:hypothetical protein
VNDVSQIENVGQCGQVVDAGIDVIATQHLAGPPVNPSVMSDHRKPHDVGCTSPSFKHLR